MAHDESTDYVQQWHKAGYSFDVMRQWVSVGVLNYEEMLTFTKRDSPFSLEEALRWKEVTDEDAARSIAWRDAGFTAEDTARWLAAREMMDPNTAIEWREFGTSPAELKEWLDASMQLAQSPSKIRELFNLDLSTAQFMEWRSVKEGPLNLWEIQQWLGAGFDPATARGWPETFDAQIAKSWRDAGFSATEALEWQVMGYPDIATEWRDARYSASEARSYADQNYFHPYDLPSTQATPPLDEQLYLLRPVATLANNISSIMDSYAANRPKVERADALRSAMASVLSVSDCQEVTDYFDGEWDDRAGEGEGRKLANGTIEACEKFYVNTAQMLQRNAKRQGMDVVALAEDVGTDPYLVEAFDKGVSRMDDDGCGRMVAEVMVMVGQSASRSWTKTGRKIKVEQAINVFRTLERKAGTSPQGLWCKAVADALQSQLWRL